MEKYLDRYDAGRKLAEKLAAYAHRNDVIILALPRGGVPVAYEIAKLLHAPLDIFIVRKLGVPTHRELAMGAIAASGVTVLNDDIIQELNISQREIDQVKYEEQNELKRRELTYRGDRPFPDLKDKTIILVDDGIATGATVNVALLALRQSLPREMIVAVPVAAAQICQKIEALADLFICPLRPTYFSAVGEWYQNFSQTEDEEVFSLLNKAKAYD